MLTILNVGWVGDCLSLTLEMFGCWGGGKKFAVVESPKILRSGLAS